MGALAQPGQQQGLTPTPPAAPRTRLSQPFTRWFPGFLKEELKPYPGRVNLVLRYTVAATLTMLCIVTFRLPGAAVGGFFSLLVSRDSPNTTLRGGLATLAWFVSGLVFVLLGAILFVDYPLTHFLWVIVSFFIAFYGISAISNYGAATAFAIVIVLSIPLWDQSGPQAAIVVANLWTAGSVVLAILITILVEYAFSVLITKDELTLGLEQRLEAVRTLLLHTAKDPVHHAARARLTQFAVVGVSRLRRLAVEDGPTHPDTARLSTTVSLVGRLIDILAPFRRYDAFTPEDVPRLRALADQIHALERRIDPKAPDRPIQSLTCRGDGPLILQGLEQTAELLRLSVSPDPGHCFSFDDLVPATPPLLKPDAFTNGEHLHFALRGCLASVLCYFLLNATFWAGLSTSLFTCVVTALISIGTSRQKQLLRTSGAICGGLILGIGSQVLILPMLDTVTGFTVMFVAVTIVAAWFITASPRLSYFGTQMALAFYLIQLRGPFAQTNLAIARDNIMGILLGLVMMWLAFETLGAKPAVQVMREIFAENLTLMAQLARPWPDGRPADLKQIRTLRDKISQNFSAVNSQADAVLFEVGRARPRSLAIRERLLNWQPQLRSLFLMQVALLHYRLQITPSELPRRVLPAAIRFDTELSSLLEAMSRSFRLRPTTYPIEPLEEARRNLEEAITQSYDQPPLRSRAVLALSSQIIDIASRLLGEIGSAT